MLGKSAVIHVQRGVCVGQEWEVRMSGAGEGPVFGVSLSSKISGAVQF
jgi:hypothetical protein